MNDGRYVRFVRMRITAIEIAACLVAGALISAQSIAAPPASLDAKAIGEASGATAAATPDGVVRIGWSRTDVTVTVDGMTLAPAAGLGSWAAFAPMATGAMVMGDTVVFEDEVDAAMDAAFTHGLAVTALHNHFFHDTPKVYFMHIGGVGQAETLAAGVKAVWDAIRAVRNAHPQPATGFGGATPAPGHADHLSRVSITMRLKEALLFGEGTHGLSGSLRSKFWRRAFAADACRRDGGRRGGDRPRRP